MSLVVLLLARGVCKHHITLMVEKINKDAEVASMKILKVGVSILKVGVSIFLITTVCPAVLYFTFLWVAHDFNPKFLKIDRCLDNGGRWNYEKGVCER
jgi:hypothetical protein